MSIIEKKITFLSVNLKILYANLCTWHPSYSQNNSKTNFPPLGFWIALRQIFYLKKRPLLVLNQILWSDEKFLSKNQKEKERNSLGVWLQNDK